MKFKNENCRRSNAMRNFGGNKTVSAQKGNICSFQNNMKVNRDFLATGEITLTGCSVQVTKQY